MKGLHFNLSSSAWLIAKTIGSLLLYRQYTCTFILGSNFISSLKCVLFLINSIFAFKGKAMIEYNCRKKGFFLFYWYLHIYFNVYEGLHQYTSVCRIDHSHANTDYSTFLAVFWLFFYSKKADDHL